MNSAGNPDIDCTSAEKLLSAFHDGELGPELQLAVQQHFESCPQCAQKIAELQEFSRIANQLAKPEVPPGIWPKLERQLSAEAQKNAEFFWLISSAPAVRGLVAIALIVVVASTATFVWLRQAEDDLDHVAVIFGRYLDGFDRNPAAAQQVLLSNYEGRTVSFDEAARQLRYRPAVGEKFLEGASLEALYLLKMPCCLCVQAVYRRHNGERLAIFEHVDDEPMWFGNRPAIHACCNGRSTSIVQVDGYLAASWRRHGRVLTVVGAKDVEQLPRLMASLDDAEG